MTKTLAEHIDRLEELDKNRTPGEWYSKKGYDPTSGGYDYAIVGAKDIIAEVFECTNYTDSVDGDEFIKQPASINSSFITLAPLMMQIIRELLWQCRQLREALEDIRDQFYYNESTDGLLEHCKLVLADTSLDKPLKED